MRLKSITIKNLKSIGEEGITVEFAPITLLFGPNNIGKSTVIKAMYLAREFFCASNPDFDNIPCVNMGPFENYVHLHNPDSVITIGLEIEISEPGANNDGFYHNGNDLRPILGNFLCSFYNGITNIKKLFFSFELGWNKQMGHSQIRNFKIEINSDVMCSVSVEKEKRKYLGRINSDGKLHNALFNYYFKEVIEEREKWAQARDLLFFWRVTMPVTSAGTPAWDSDFCYSWQTTPVDAREYDPLVVNFATSNITNVVNTYLGPARAFRDCLNDLVHIGPLREIPQQARSPQTASENENWYNGLAAWQMLKGIDDSQLAEINRMINGKDFLHTGYDISRKHVLPLDINSPLAKFLAVASVETQEINAEVREDIKRLFKKNPEVVVSFVNFENGAIVKPADMGAGVSQVIPVIIAVVASSEDALIAIEEPELHIHPAWQTALADVLIVSRGTMLDQKIILLETHSEHLLLRLLRRIHETYELKSGRTGPVVGSFKYSIFPEDISIFWIGEENGKVKATKMEIDEEGDFTTLWPEGFFEERGAELF